MLKQDITLELDSLNMTYENVSQHKIQYHKGFVGTYAYWNRWQKLVFFQLLISFQILILNCQAEEVILAYVHIISASVLG
jgi:hypothetical protein